MTPIRRVIALLLVSMHHSVAAVCDCAEVASLEATLHSVVATLARYEARIATLEGRHFSTGTSGDYNGDRTHNPDVLLAKRRELVETGVATRISGESITVDTLYVEGAIFYKGWKMPDINTFAPTPLPTASPTPGPTEVPKSCAAFYSESATNIDGFYTIEVSGVTVTVWCSFSTEYAWRIGVIATSSIAAYPSYVDGPTYQSICAAHGYPFAGRRVAQSTEAWIAQKRMLWDSNHALKTAGWPTGMGSLVMPLWKINSGATVVSIYDNVEAILPPSSVGDRCDSGSGNPTCGYYFSNGWSSDDFSAPDPEDFAAATYISCIGSEEG